ncbi:methyl-accepting chemotaxis protein [Clostridium puniceum]|nr:methyl-accepting chemotaxis protein [Clostridium puniceum]
MELSLLDTENNILFSNNKKLIGTKVENGINDNIKDIESKTFNYNNCLVTLNTCSNHWRLLNKIPQQYILKEVEKSKKFTFIITIICIVISSTFGLFFAKKISSPINKLVMKMKEVENGDLSVFTDIIGEDEIAILSKSFNSMISSISDLIEQTRNVSIIVANQAEELKEISKQTSQTSEEICKSMKDITEGTVNQSNELEKTIEVMGNLSGSINKMIINITNATTMANETKNIGDSSLDIVKQLDKKTKNTNEVMAEIITNIDVLTNSIKEIEQVIGLIKGISEQTNLLSLNASIEAARAGENGKGFAVVAEEVKKLADESKESAESINNVIKNIYKKASHTKDLVDNSRIVFNEQTESVKFTNNSFITIINATEKITNEIQDIEKLINEINTEKLQTLEATNSMKFIKYIQGALRILMEMELEI